MVFISHLPTSLTTLHDPSIAPICPSIHAQVLLNASPSLLTLPDHQGSTPLHHATIQDSTDCLHTLLGYVPPKGSVPLDVNHTDLSQWTCLHYAVAYYNLECVSLLVGSGAGVSVEDREGKTVLDYASDLSEGREQMLAILKGTAL